MSIFGPDQIHKNSALPKTDRDFAHVSTIRATLRFCLFGIEHKTANLTVYLPLYDRLNE